MTFVALFLIFDTWYQYVMGHDIFGVEKYNDTRLTGPFRRPFIGMWITKLIILPLFTYSLNKIFPLKEKSFLAKDY